MRQEENLINPIKDETGFCRGIHSQLLYTSYYNGSISFSFRLYGLIWSLYKELRSDLGFGYRFLSDDEQCESICEVVHGIYS